MEKYFLILGKITSSYKKAELLQTKKDDSVKDAILHHLNVQGNKSALVSDIQKAQDAKYHQHDTKEYWTPPTACDNGITPDGSKESPPRHVFH